MSMIRDITQVIGKMLEDIPADQTGLRASLEHISNQAIYTAPEIMRHRWQEAQRVLGQHFPGPGELNEWQAKVVATWMNQ